MDGLEIRNEHLSGIVPHAEQHGQSARGESNSAVHCQKRTRQNCEMLADLHWAKANPLHQITNDMFWLMRLQHAPRSTYTPRVVIVPSMAISPTTKPCCEPSQPQPPPPPVSHCSLGAMEMPEVWSTLWRWPEKYVILCLVLSLSRDKKSPDSSSELSSQK